MPVTATVLPVPTFLSAKVARAVGIGEDVAGDAVVGERDGRGGGAVVDLVDAGGADGQRPRRDVGGGRRRGVGQGVVAGVGAVIVIAADRDRLAGADVLVGEGGRGVGYR